jgi:DnaJ-class molecular chaperone
MPAVAVTKCDTCNGRGYTFVPQLIWGSAPNLRGVEMVKEPCEPCQGKGEVPVCEECGGAGTVERTIHDSGHPDADCECVCECKYPGRKNEAR